MLGHLLRWLPRHPTRAKRYEHEYGWYLLDFDDDHLAEEAIRKLGHRRRLDERLVRSEGR